MKTVPQDLLDYLMTLIAPPIEDPQIPVILDVTGYDFTQYADASLHGIILRGTPTDEQSKEIVRACKPGAHVLAMAAEGDLVGDVSACRLEDAGMEIRDAIQVLEPGVEFWYAAKESTKNRNAGCDALVTPPQWGLKPAYVQAEEGDTPDDALTLEADLETAGISPEQVQSLLEGGTIAESEVPENLVHFFKLIKAAGRGNSHPTLKAIDLCAKMLSSLPPNVKTVLDPFAGSGSMGLGAIKTGHDYIGIELNPEYAEIADARLRYWASTHQGWTDRVILSDMEKKGSEETPVSAEDFFGI